MKKSLSVSTLVLSGILTLSGCAEDLPDSYQFTGDIKPTSEKPSEVENLCPIILRAICIREFESTGAKLPGRVGSVLGNQRIVKEPAEKGLFVFGPVATLLPGNYEFQLEYSRIGTDDLPKYEIPDYQVISVKDNEDTGEKTTIKIASAPLPLGNDILIVPIELDNVHNQVQMRVIYRGKGEISVSRMKLLPQNKIITAP